MKKLLDGTKNAVLYCSGVLNNDEQLLFDANTFTSPPTQVRIEGILYALSDKAVLESGDIFIPLSGRGKMNFEEFHALPLEDLKLTIRGTGLYFIMIDLEKH